ncbi:Na+/H+ antiporter subunit E [Azoarcus sp. TTM-91]|uniref:Na+/H+ antiporter subunit E n=1 Tax=Azoarcus sp. TTM-91 TaxID=2691581 RepID=UPI00145C77D3|nr:Na+/H+ antiporter subunit E [Azoarcus sp. TTM-91]NMG33549.1 Na+/H+ antiporter subunit E [Azoarcus sp. TTM-91]
MRRLTGRILLPLALLVAWLLLNDTLSFGQVLLGALFAMLISLAIRQLRPLAAQPHRLHLLFGLLWHVLLDIIRSNIAVAAVILGANRQQPNVGFITIPLDMRDPHGLAMLAVILTATPGTVWTDLSPDTNKLTLHVLDLKDEAGWIRLIKDRYERPLMEIFE